MSDPAKQSNAPAEKAEGGAQQGSSTAKETETAAGRTRRRPAVSKAKPAVAKAETLREGAGNRDDKGQVSVGAPKAGGDDTPTASTRSGEQSGSSAEKSALAAIGSAQESVARAAEDLAEQVREFTRRYESATVAGKLAEGRHMLLGHAAYLLFALTPITGVSVLFGLMLCYRRVGEQAVSGTVLHSHFRWLIRTFWFTLGLLVVAGLGWALEDWVGVVLTLAVLIWFAHRLVKGWLSLYDGKGISAPGALL